MKVTTATVSTKPATTKLTYEITEITVIICSNCGTPLEVPPEIACVRCIRCGTKTCSQD